MGWFWGSADDKDGNKSQDPLRDLDPSLRDFLKKESPIKYDSSNSPAPKPAASTTTTSSETQKATESPATAPDKSSSPPTLYKDGRYSELWATYRPLSEVENETKTDQEKITDVIEGFKHRRAEIGKAALENCALEQLEVSDCFRSGGIAARMTLCREQNRSLKRCHEMQSKFLKALGYLSSLDRPAEVDEQIQMHADSLYHRMLDQEKEMEAAKAEGRPIPSFPPLLSHKPKFVAVEAAQRDVDDGKLKPSDLKPAVQEKFKERLKGLSPVEREIEESAIKGELRAGEQVAQQLGTIYEKQAEERKKRQQAGKETLQDKIASIFGGR